MENTQNPANNVTSISEDKTIQNIPQNEPTSTDTEVTNNQSSVTSSSVEKLLENMSKEHENPHSESKSKVAALVLIVLGIIFVVGAVAFYMLQTNNENQPVTPEIVVTPTPTPEPSVSPTPQEQVESDPIINNIDSSIRNTSPSAATDSNLDNAIDQIEEDFDGFGTEL
jgi:hypothetical protein